jgi:hypothetical protein
MQPNSGIASGEKSHPFMQVVTTPFRENATPKAEIRGEGSLIAVGPIVTALREYQEKVTLLKQMVPNSDVIPAVQGFLDRLTHALREAQQIDLFLTVDEIERRIGRPRSTITSICRTHGEECGATKVKGVWSIHWPTFERFLTSSRNHPRQEAA